MENPIKNQAEVQLNLCNMYSKANNRLLLILKSVQDKDD